MSAKKNLLDEQASTINQERMVSESRYQSKCYEVMRFQLAHRSQGGARTKAVRQREVRVDKSQHVSGFDEGKSIQREDEDHWKSVHALEDVCFLFPSKKTECQDG